MAKIPTAADIAQVTPGSLPRVNIPTGAFGERTAQAMEKMGGTITDIGPVSYTHLRAHET